MQGNYTVTASTCVWNWITSLNLLHYYYFFLLFYVQFVDRCWSNSICVWRSANYKEFAAPPGKRKKKWHFGYSGDLLQNHWVSDRSQISSAATEPIRVVALRSRVTSFVFCRLLRLLGKLAKKSSLDASLVITAGGWAHLFAGFGWQILFCFHGNAVTPALAEDL